MKFSTDFCKVYDGFLRSLGRLFVKFRTGF